MKNIKIEKKHNMQFKNIFNSKYMWCKKKNIIYRVEMTKDRKIMRDIKHSSNQEHDL